MKIPSSQQGDVKSVAVPTPYANTDTRGAFGASFGQAFDKVGGAVDAVQVEMKRADAEAERAAKEAKAKADAISQANADAAYQRAETARMVGGSNRRSLIEEAFGNPDGPDPTAGDVKDVPGYLSSKGKDAYAQSGPLLEEMEKQRQQIAKDHFADPEARERWLARSSGMFADTERKVESHAAQQFEVARRDALQGMVASSLEAAANAKDGPELEAITRRAEDRIRELQSSPEGAKADMERFRRDALEVHIRSLLNSGDVKRARGQYTVAKDVLGSKADNVNAAIVAAEKAQTVQANDVEAQKQIDAIVESGTGPAGKPDFEVMDAKLSLVPPGKLRDEMEQRMGAAKEKAARRWKMRVDRFADAASSTYEKTRSLGAVDPAVKSWLLENAPDEWKKLRHDAEADINRWRAHRSGDAAARREQAEVDRLARLEFMELPPAERAIANVGEFLRGRGVSPIGASTVRGLQTSAAEIVRKGDAMGEAEFVRQVEAKTQGLVGADKETRKDIKAAAVDAYAQLREKAKGKPSSDDVEAEVARLTRVAATKPRNPLVTWLPFVDEKGAEMGVEKDIREKKATKGKNSPAGKPKRIRLNGRTGTWDGVSKLPEGAEVLSDG